MALVVGASRGIGAAIAEALGAAGAQVVVAARSEQPGRLPGTVGEVAERIRAAGGDALPVRCDVTSEQSVADAVATAVATYGGLDAVVYSAARLSLTPTARTSAERWEAVLRTNLTGAFLVTRAVLPHVVARGRGSLIALTTTGVGMTHLGSNAYWVSKAGLERYYTGLAAELAPHGIAVNCLAPTGVVLTEGWRASGGMDVPPELVEDVSVVAAAAVLLAQESPGGRTGGVHLSRDLVPLP